MNTSPEDRLKGIVTGSVKVKRSIERYSGTIFIILVVLLAMTGLLLLGLWHDHISQCRR